MFEDQNLLNIMASDKYRYCLKILDILFTKEEIKIGAVEPNSAGLFVALNPGNISFLFHIKKTIFLLTKFFYNLNCFFYLDLGLIQA